MITVICFYQSIETRIYCEGCRIPPPTKKWTVRIWTIPSLFRLCFRECNRHNRHGIYSCIVQRRSGEKQVSSFFQVTFWSPKWRSLNPCKGHLKHPKRSLGRTWLVFFIYQGNSVNLLPIKSGIYQFSFGMVIPTLQKPIRTISHQMGSLENHDGKSSKCQPVWDGWCGVEGSSVKV